MVFRFLLLYDQSFNFFLKSFQFQLRSLINYSSFLDFNNYQLFTNALWNEYSEKFSKSYRETFFFSIRVFFHGHWRLTEQQGKVGGHLLFQSTTSTRSRIFRHLFATLHVRWLSYIFNRTACIYQAVTRWDLPPYWITIWMIDDVILTFVCLLDDLILGFCYSNLTRWIWNRWNWTRIDYRPSIISELANQVC